MLSTLNLLRRRRKNLSCDLFFLLFALVDLVTGKVSEIINHSRARDVEM